MGTASQTTSTLASQQINKTQTDPNLEASRPFFKGQNCAGRRPVSPQLIFIVSVVDFCSTSHFYIYIVCVDRSGSLSGSAFNQLRLATLNIVLTILYYLKTVLQWSLLQCLNSLYKSVEVF